MLKFFLKQLSFSLLAISSLSAATEYDLIIDINFSPYAGGEDLLLATRAFEKTQELLFKQQPSKTAQARLFRLSDLLTVWLPVNYLTTVVQHEVFGHGYRIRSLGSSRANVFSYRIGSPPPYGPGGGVTSYGIKKKITTMELACIASGGVESTAILANLTKFKWLSSRKLDSNQAILYFLSQQDLTQYISSLKDLRTHPNIDPTGHDINSWLFWINATYPNAHLSSSYLNTLSLINFLDPFSFYAIWACLHYIASGRDTKIPMIPFFGAGYLFSSRLGLAPYGPEIFFENYFAANGRVFYGYLKGGGHAGNNYFGAGTFIPNVWHKDPITFGVRCDLWHQPKLLLQPGAIPVFNIDREMPLHPIYSSSELHEMSFGGAFSMLLAWSWTEVFGAEIELGGKTQGFLPGYSLVASPTVRGGLSAKF